MPGTMFEIGKKIKALRQQRGWSQSHIAELLNISVPAFSKIESDITDLSVSRLRQIADVFNVSAVELISNQPDPSQSLLDELQEAKNTIAAQNLKINHLQEYIITLYEQLHKQQTQQDVING
jgi:transcriptional regulator with XRE-family HTH domain